MQQIPQFKKKKKDLSHTIYVFILYCQCQIYIQKYFLRSNSAGKKSHTYEEGGPPQNFCLAFIDELEKQIFIKKTVEVGQ